MKTRMILIAALLAVAGCASSAALAQDNAPPQGDRMGRMQGMAEAFDQSDDAAERQALMHEHMGLMREQMAEMQGMMDHAAPADGAAPDMAAMHEHMGVMHGMMMQMMAQQDMMMRMQEQPEGEDGE